MLPFLFAFSFSALVSCQQEEINGPAADTSIKARDSSNFNNTLVTEATTVTPTYTVSTYDQLKSALSKANSGQVVYLADNAEINMTGKGALKVPAGVTLTSGRGKTSTTLGGLIYTTNVAHGNMLTAGGSGVKFVGLRVKGANTTTSRTSSAYCRGIYSSFPNLEVDNCEIYGWNHAGVYLADGATNAYIHHSYIHHNQQSGLGYGISMGKATAKIMNNYFDYNRHAIAGSGISGSGYEAAYNTVMPHGTEHSFDMHGYGGDGANYIAGDYVIVHDNLFYMTAYSAITVRGTPREGLNIYNNKFAHKSQIDAMNIYTSTSKRVIGTNSYSIVISASINPGPKSL